MPEREKDTRARQEQERRRKAARLLGEVLPDVTEDETPAAWGERGAGSRDDELRRNVPPHHGG